MAKQIRKANITVAVIQFIGLNIEITKGEQQRISLYLLLTFLLNNLRLYKIFLLPLNSFLIHLTNCRISCYIFLQGILARILFYCYSDRDYENNFPACLGA